METNQLFYITVLPVLQTMLDDSFNTFAYLKQNLASLFYYAVASIFGLIVCLERAAFPLFLSL